MTVSPSASSSSPAATVTVWATFHVPASNVRAVRAPPFRVTDGSMPVTRTVVSPAGSVARATV